MIIFKDRLTGEEMCSDSFCCGNDETGTILEIKGKLTTQRDDGQYDIGGNPSQEEQEEQCEGTSVSGVDVCLNHKLQDVSAVFGDLPKKDFQGYMKKYLKSLMEHIPADEVKEWQEKIAEAFKKILANYSDYSFFIGENADIGDVLNGKGMIAMCRWEGETPVMCYIKKGLEEEKC